MTTEVKIAPHLYLIKRQRHNVYYTRLGGKRVPLGSDEQQARGKLVALLELPSTESTIRAMCAGYPSEQRQMRAGGDDTALGERTLEDYELCLRTACKVFGDMHPQAFKPSDAAKYLKMRRRQGCGVRGNKEMSALSSAFNYGMTSGAVESNPCRGYRRNPERPRQRKVAISELNDFLAFAKTKGRSSYLVALIGCTVALTGRRRGEILQLPKAAMSEAGMHVKDCKTKAGEAERFYLVEWSPILRQVITETLSLKHRRAKDRPPFVSSYLFASRDACRTPITGSKHFGKSSCVPTCRRGRKIPDGSAPMTCERCMFPRCWSKSATRRRTRTNAPCERSTIDASASR